MGVVEVIVENGRLVLDNRKAVRRNIGVADREVGIERG